MDTPYYPGKSVEIASIDKNGKLNTFHTSGLTLRDAIAMDVLRLELQNQLDRNRVHQPQEIARWCYEMANAMIEERSK
jgi:hypothetical protein